MLQPTFSSYVKNSAKIVNRVFYFPYTDLVLVPNVAPVSKASIWGEKTRMKKYLNVIITAYLEI
ncbi:MAG: hypothetical protein HWQ23_03945 [Nostoc sp. JL33]|nr:hypothetical protein [Nostoc sp. JL33]